MAAKEHAMTEPQTTVEEKIILATIGCIEQYGMSGATNRRIAQAAGVNIAAINYYFRHREVLIQRAMEITMKSAFDLSDTDPMPGASVREYCAAVFLHIVEGGLRYPGLTRAHFHNLLTEGRDDPLLAEHVNRFVGTLAADLEGRGCPHPADECRLALTQICSAAFLAILAPVLYSQSTGIDLHDRDTREAYVTRLVDKLLG
jgi:AcrR family transcriptional regulator